MLSKYLGNKVSDEVYPYDRDQAYITVGLLYMVLGKPLMVTLVWGFLKRIDIIKFVKL